MKGKRLEDYLSLLKTDDIIASTQKAREESMRLLNDQGISVMAWFLSEVIADAIEHPDRLLERRR